jgi:hypothetical protein
MGWRFPAHKHHFLNSLNSLNSKTRTPATPATPELLELLNSSPFSIIGVKVRNSRFQYSSDRRLGLIGLS